MIIMNKDWVTAERVKGGLEEFSRIMEIDLKEPKVLDGG